MKRSGAAWSARRAHNPKVLGSNPSSAISGFMSAEFDRSLEILSTLLGDKGCPWDRKQTIDSIMECLEKECKEVAEAIENGDYENLKEEIGDVMWDLLFMSKIAEKENRFGVNDVLDAVNEKMVRRHPHVFGDVKAETEEEAHQAFLDAKAKEKSRI